MKLTLGFSPCPNDTFIFDALVNGKINTEGLEFEPVLEDVETLNNWAAEGKLDVSKLSFPALFQQMDQYVILYSGAALGKGVGPLLIAKNPATVPTMANSTIAIPGENTTANFLLSYAFPDAKNKRVYLFSEIENAVLQGEVDLGVIIHENRFTYQQKGLAKVCDLGAVWEEKEKAPIPLGCIAAKRSLPNEVIEKIDTLIRNSLVHAFAGYPQLSPFIIQHAQAMDEEVMRQHIELYVNNYSTDLGEEGKRAIEKLFAVYSSKDHSTINTAGAELFANKF
jgi:1,4-dihydroxy-6-naphthoate synthase